MFKNISAQKWLKSLKGITYSSSSSWILYYISYDTIGSIICLIIPVNKFILFFNDKYGFLNKYLIYKIIDKKKTDYFTCVYVVCLYFTRFIFFVLYMVIWILNII